MGAPGLERSVQIVGSPHAEALASCEDSVEPSQCRGDRDRWPTGAACVVRSCRRDTRLPLDAVPPCGADREYAVAIERLPSQQLPPRHTPVEINVPRDLDPSVYPSRWQRKGRLRRQTCFADDGDTVQRRRAPGPAWVQKERCVLCRIWSSER